MLRVIAVGYSNLSFNSIEWIREVEVEKAIHEIWKDLSIPLNGFLIT